VTTTVHRYGNHRSQFGELTLPDMAGPSAVATLIHGGCWRQRYGLRQMDALVGDLAGRGWAVWNLEYRRLGVRGGGGWPATLEDVAAGIDHLASLEARLDLDRVCTIGHSAGGQLALWAGSRDVPGVRVTDAVGQSALADLETSARDGTCGGQVQRLLGGEPEQVPDRYAAASPIRRLPLRCRTLVVHGLADDVVPASQSIAYADAAGADCARALPGDEGHFEHLDPQSRSWQAVVGWL
jgi:dipeptidyl aminopeptidase/acylaminoacyl peptidase